MVTAFSPSDYQYSSARMECNACKNRNPDLVPVEASRCRIMPFHPKSWTIFPKNVNKFSPKHHRLKINLKVMDLILVFIGAKQR
jgi:hypothetical protein